MGNRLSACISKRISRDHVVAAYRTGGFCPRQMSSQHEKELTTLLRCYFQPGDTLPLLAMGTLLDVSALPVCVTPEIPTRCRRYVRAWSISSRQMRRLKSPFFLVFLTTRRVLSVTQPACSPTSTAASVPHFPQSNSCPEIHHRPSVYPSERRPYLINIS